MNDSTITRANGSKERYTRRLPLALIEKVPKDAQALRVFCVIEAHRNKATGIANPTIPTIAKHCGVTTRAVVRAVAKLMEAQIYDPASQQRGKNTHYQLGAAALAALTKDGNVLSAESTEDADGTNRGRKRSETKDASVLQTACKTVNEQQHAVAAIEKEKTISRLVALGVDRLQATKRFSEDPLLAEAWSTISRDDYDVDNLGGFINSRLKAGIEPDEPNEEDAAAEKRRRYLNGDYLPNDAHGTVPSQRRGADLSQHWEPGEKELLGVA